MWSDGHAAAWRRVTDFVHDNTASRIGLQIGHSGRKGSTCVPWEGTDLPLGDGNWELIAPSPIPYLPGNVVPRQMSRADMDTVIADFVRSTRLGV
jgi:anthraniloyl-CoA monooxygenase